MHRQWSWIIPVLMLCRAACTADNIHTGDPAGIQRAINALPETGGTIDIPAGTYVLEAAIRPRDNVCLRGAGPGTVLQICDMRQSKLTAPLKTGQNFIMVKDPGRFRPGMEIFVHGRRDWGPQTEQVFSYRITEIQGHRFFLDKTAVFEQPVESAVCSGVPAIFVRKKKNVVIENLTVDGNARHNRAINVNNKMAGIYLWAVSDCSIRQCNICNCAGDGISIQFPPTGFKSSAPPQWDGPDNHGGSGIMILNNRIDACDNWGLHIGGGQSQTLIRGNIIRNCGYDGLFFCYDNTFTIISDNLIMHNRNNGIGGVGRGNGIDSDRENLIHNNICAYNGRCGIEIDGGSGNLIHGNICYGNSRRKPGRHPGIRVMSSAQETLVTNNLYRDTGNPTTQAE